MTTEVQTQVSNGQTKQNPHEFEPQVKGGGVLYVIGTPIGNLSDLTFRALEILKKVHWIACEDTRRAQVLLGHYGIHKPLLTVFGPKEKKQTPRILDLLSESRSVALLSDAGTPGLSDPGQFLVREAQKGGFRLEAIPGASSLTCAVSLSGCCENGFTFLGFLPRRKKRIEDIFLKTKALERAIIFFESPFRIAETLGIALQALGEECFCWLGREITKKFEEHVSGTLSQVLTQVRGRTILGEITVVLKPYD